MKLHTTHQSSLIQGENIESVDIQLSERGKALAAKMFRNSLYQNKPWAVVREIIANAVDEHKKHCPDKAILITAPTTADPYFRVRDFALGLPKDNVFSVFFQLGETSKDQSNDDIGGFGIGANSPLAYASIFYVTSYYGGKATTFCANVDGQVSTAHSMVAEDSFETGIEVAVPVEPRDFSIFANHIKHFLRFSSFSNFEIVGGEIYAKPIAKRFECKDGFVSLDRFGSSYDSENEDIVARVAGVTYSLGKCSITSPFKSSTLCLEIPNGEVQIHESRERLEMDKRTVLRIQEAIDSVEAEAREEVKKKLLAAKTASEKFACAGDTMIFNLLGSFDGVDMPKKAKMTKDGHSVFTWGEGKINKETMKKLLFSRRTRNWSGRAVSVVPDLSNLPKHDYLPWGFSSESYTFPKSLLFSEGTVRKDRVVAMAEKHNLAQPVLVLHTSELPEGWTEGVDALVLREDSVTKEEVKAIRDNYSMSSGGGRSSSAVKSAIYGYCSTYRSDSAKVYGWGVQKHVDQGGKYLLIDGRSHKVKSWFGLAESLKLPNERVLMVFDANIKRWKGINEKHFVSFDEVKKLLRERTINKIKADDYTKYEDTRNIVKGYGIEEDNGVEGFLRERASLLFPDVDTKQENPKWEKLDKKWQTVKPAHKQLIKAFVYTSYRVSLDRDTCPDLYKVAKAKAKKIFS